MKPGDTLTLMIGVAVIALLIGLGSGFALSDFLISAGRSASDETADPKAHLETSDAGYGAVAAFVESYPELKVQALAAMADDKITEWEYEQIEERKCAIAIKRNKQKVIDACLINIGEEMASKPGGRRCQCWNDD